MKLKEAKQILKKRNVDAIILFSKTPNFQYFVPGGLEHCVLIIARNETVLLTSPLSAPKIKGIRTVTYSGFHEEFAAVLKKNKVKRAGVDEFSLYLRQKKLLSGKVSMKDVGEDLSSLRVTKTPEEISRIRKACRITDDVFSLLLKEFWRFKTEQDVYNFIRIEFIKRDADIAYEPIVASGWNATVPHHEPTSKLKKGFLVLDIGAKYKGYCSDMTRTIYLGTPNMGEIAIYEKILEVQEECIRLSKVGASAADIHNHAVKMLGKDAQYFNHALGHGFGVEIHEAPTLAPRSKQKIQDKTIITIEPGYYNQKTGVGIRIEDDLYVTKGRTEFLNKSTKDLICIKKW